MTKRRDFLKSTAAAGGALALGLGSPPVRALVPESRASDPQVRLPAPRSLSILILGGTNLTGPHNVRYAVERGHEVTIFTRGRREPGLFQDVFENVEHLIGDRADNLTALEGRTWDAVIDASGSQVEWTRDSAELLRDSGRYMYISSTGVYYPYLTTEIGEDTEVALEDPTEGEDVAYRYGVMKANSENEARRVFGDRATIVRPGYIVGPLDSTQRGTYWPERIRVGGDIVVPGMKTDQVQQIDVRDLTEFMIHLLEDDVSGTFNITGPGSSLTMAEYIYGVGATSSAEIEWHWIEDYDFLQEQGYMYQIPWIMPMGNNLGSQRIDVSRAKAAGLTYRPLAVTAMDTLEWYHSDAVSEEVRANPRWRPTPEEEQGLLEAWRARSG